MKDKMHFNTFILYGTRESSSGNQQFTQRKKALGANNLSDLGGGGP